MTTPVQQKIFDYVRDCTADAGYCPTLKQIGDQFGITPQAVSRHVDKLVTRGLLERESALGLRKLRVANVPDIRKVGREEILAELARRGITFGALDSGVHKSLSRPAASCAADTCGCEVDPGRLFCLTHWRALPFDLREEILATHRSRDLEAYQAAVSRARDIADGARAA